MEGADEDFDPEEVTVVEMMEQPSMNVGHEILSTGVEEEMEGFHHLGSDSSLGLSNANEKELPSMKKDS